MGWIGPILRLRYTPLCSVSLRSGRTGGGTPSAFRCAQGGVEGRVGWLGLSFDFAALRCAPFRFAQDERRGERRVRFAALSTESKGAWVGLARSFDFATLRCAPFRFAQDERGGGRRVRFAALRAELKGAWVGLARSFDFATLRCAPFRFAQDERAGERRVLYASLRANGGDAECVSLRSGRTGGRRSRNFGDYDYDDSLR